MINKLILLAFVFSVSFFHKSQNVEAQTNSQSKDFIKLDTLIRPKLPLSTEPIQFSPQILPIESLLFLIFDPFAQVFPNNFSKVGAQVSSDGAYTDLFDKKGEVVLRLFARSLLTGDHTHRTIDFSVIDPYGNPIIRFLIRTAGQNLTDLPLTDIRRARLPYFIHEQNANWSDVKVWIRGNYDFGYIIESTQNNNINYIHVRVSDADNTSILEYDEVSGVRLREYTYRISPRKKLVSETFEVKKESGPEMIDGTESFFINGVKVTAYDFQNKFDEDFLNDIVKFWQSGFISLANYLLYIKVPLK
jgi:hypothetical protein